MKKKNTISNIKKFLKIKGFENIDINKNLEPLYMISFDGILILFNSLTETLLISFRVTYIPEKAAKFAIEFSKNFKNVSIIEDHIYKGDNILTGEDAFHEMFKKLENKITTKFMKHHFQEQIMSDHNIGFHC